MYISSHSLARRIGTEFGESNNYYFDRCVEGHQQKSNRRNDAIAFENTSKISERSKKQNFIVLEKCFSKIFNNFHSKEHLVKSFLSHAAVCVFREKEFFHERFIRLFKKNKQVTANANELYSELHRMATSDSEWYSKEHQVATSGTMNDNKSQRMTTSENE